MNFSVYTLSSGSRGNAVYIETDKTRILVDAGISCRATDVALKTLGTSVAELDAVFITHEHTDHVRGLYQITKKNPLTVHIAEPSAEGVTTAGGETIVHPPLFEVKLGELEISSFVTPHDSKCSVGYIIKTEGHTVGIATDFGVMTDTIAQRLAECDSVILESNHDVAMLESGSYPYFLKQRILSRHGHLSNADCADCAVLLAKAGVKRLLLAHLSEENNRPQLALTETANALSRCGITGISLSVAGRNNIVRLC